MKYIIGDIHGEYDKIAKLLDILEKDATEYVFLGDYLDKGKHVKKTIELLTALSKTKKCVFLMGDHEFAWLKYFEGEERFLDFILKYGGAETVKSYLGEKISDEKIGDLLSDRKKARELFAAHEPFLRGLKGYHDAYDGFVCVHAGIYPEEKDKPLEEQDREKMVFVRNDFIDSKFLYKGRKVIFGHTASAEPYVDEYKIGIDTGAVYPEMGNLTAFNIEERSFVQAKKGRFRINGKKV